MLILHSYTMLYCYTRFCPSTPPAKKKWRPWPRLEVICCMGGSLLLNWNSAAQRAELRCRATCLSWGTCDFTWHRMHRMLPCYRFEDSHGAPPRSSVLVGAVKMERFFLCLGLDMTFALEPQIFQWCVFSVFGVWLSNRTHLQSLQVLEKNHRNLDITFQNLSKPLFPMWTVFQTAFPPLGRPSKQVTSWRHRDLVSWKSKRTLSFSYNFGGFFCTA